MKTENKPYQDLIYASVYKQSKAIQLTHRLPFLVPVKESRGWRLEAHCGLHFKAAVIYGQSDLWVLVYSDSGLCRTTGQSAGGLSLAVEQIREVDPATLCSSTLPGPSTGHRGLRGQGQRPLWPFRTPVMFGHMRAQCCAGPNPAD